MQIEEFHYEIERQWNIQSNDHRKKLTDIQKDALINSMIFEYVEIFLHGTNPQQYDLGFEVNSQRIDMLQSLVRVEDITSSFQFEDQYHFNFSATSEKYRSYRTSRALTNCGYFQVFEEQHEDGIVLVDYHRKPSRKFKRAVCFVREDKVIVHTDSKFMIEHLRMTYIKEPNLVALGTYEGVEIPGQASNIIPRQNCDISETYHPLLISLCIQELHRIYTNQVDRVTYKEKLIDTT